MELLDLVKIKQLLGSLERSVVENNIGCYFNCLVFNGFEICFYAGTKAFCEPKVSYDTLLHYKTIQLDIIEVVKGFNDVVQPGSDNRFKNFSWCKYFTHLDNKGKDKNSYMGCNIPLDEVCQLIKDVYKISRLKIFF